MKLEQLASKQKNRTLAWDYSIKEAESKLTGRGRILVRPSGTENLIRVMAEGPDENEIKKLVEGIAQEVAKYLCK